MRRILSALLLLALPVPMLAQSPEERIDAARARARNADVPVALIESKVADGRARGVPMERLAGAVERRAESLMAARRLLGDAPNEPGRRNTELAAAADALDLGVSEVVLMQLSETAGRERRGIAIAVLGQLVAMGRTPTQALERVTTALQRGESLTRLPDEVAAARVRRGRPGLQDGPGGMPGGRALPGPMPGRIRVRQPGG
ncbi:MAG TPA: hypothetical protein VK939_01740 [Longimicrobiales bacterium]|nr:hypothetical protein [Longimicrobiales bacterium]